jgi:hypothetical protein
MLAFLERILAIAAVIVLLLLCNQPRPFARGSQVGHDPPWNPEHIEGLPPEVRNVVIACAGIHRAPVTTLRPISAIRTSSSCTLNICTVTSSQYSAGKVVASTKNMFLPEATTGS